VATFEVFLRLSLAVVYGAAAIGKLLSARSTDLLIETFELSPRLRPAVSALAAFELTIAGALLFPATSRAAAAVSFLLLLLFSALVVRSISRGRAGACNCFGRLHSSKIGWNMIVRNVVLISVSTLIVVPSDQSSISLLVDGLAEVSQNAWLDAAVAVAVSSLVAALLHNRFLQGRDTEPIDDGASKEDRVGFAASGGPRPDPVSVPVVLLDGRVTTLQETLAGDTRNVLVFIDPACGPCRSLLPGLQGLWSLMADRLFVVTRGPADFSRDLLAGFPADRSLVDVDDALMIRYGVLATPSAVVLSAAGALVEALVVGPTAIQNLASQSAYDRGAPWSASRSRSALNERGDRVSDHVLSPFTSPFQAAFSRRETLTVGLSAAVFASVASRLGRAVDLSVKRLSAGQKGTQCPTCGTCMICDAPGAGSRPKKLNCRPCKQKCTANDLCVNYANKLPAYVSIHSYLLAKGFSQSGEPTALGLEQNGTLSFIGTNTIFTSKSSAHPDALLMYTLTNAAGSASAAILNSEGNIASIVAVNSTGQVVTIDVPVRPVLPSSVAAKIESSSSPEPERDALHAEVASCEEVCSAALSLMIGVLTPLAAAGEAASITTIKLALPLLKGMLSAAIGGGSENDLALTTMGAAYTAASLLNLGEESAFSANIAKDKISSLAEQIICSTLVCTLKLEGCCNYTGACYDLDSVCERNCPGGLAHPLAHCDVYLTRLGKKIKISSIVPGL
jgi:hypothetical protein